MKFCKKQTLMQVQQILIMYYLKQLGFPVS